MSEKLVVLAAAIQAKAASTAHADALDHLAKAADCFDQAGLRKEADIVTGVIERLAEGDGYTGRPDDWGYPGEVLPPRVAPQSECADVNDAKGKPKKKKTPEERKVYLHYGFTPDIDLAEDGDDDQAWEDED